MCNFELVLTWARPGENGSTMTKIFDYRDKIDISISGIEDGEKRLDCER